MDKHYKIHADGNLFVRMKNQDGKPCMFTAEVHMMATDDNGNTSVIGTLECKFDQAEFFPYLLKKAGQVLGPFLEQVMNADNLASRIERPTLELVEKFRTH